MVVRGGEDLIGWCGACSRPLPPAALRVVYEGVVGRLRDASIDLSGHIDDWRSLQRLLADRSLWRAG